MRRQATPVHRVAFETINAVTVEHPIEHGEVLKASDLVIQRRPKSEGTVITNLRAASGLAARHELRPGQPLRNTDLMKPAIVQRNDTVIIVYEAPGFTLTLRGQAQEDGALGDTINVLNVESKRVVQGVISGPGRVTVQHGAKTSRREHAGARTRAGLPATRSTAARTQHPVGRVQS